MKKRKTLKNTSSRSNILLQNICHRILQHDGQIWRHSRSMGRRLPPGPGQFLPASPGLFYLPGQTLELTDFADFVKSSIRQPRIFKGTGSQDFDKNGYL
jgi:hypothetical protein